MTAAGDKALAAALSALGRPYVYGAAPDDTSCFDCSSLVQWAWRQAGTQLPRASIDQFQALAPVGIADLQPGDLVFYDFHLQAGPRYRGINHVVMYAGEGRVVEASSQARAVRVTALAAKGRPAGAGRPGPARSGWSYEVRRAFALTICPGARGGWLVERGGRVVPFGNAPFLGSGARGSRVAGIAAHPCGVGFWLATPAGRVSCFGTAAFRGDLAGLAGRRTGRPIVALAAVPSGGGYWLADSGGRLHSFGTAMHRGDLRTVTTPGTAPVVAMAVAPSGAGYWLADATGRVHAFGAVAHRGDLSAEAAHRPPVVAMAAAPSGNGYWLADAAGRVHAFGNARRFGQPDARPGLRPEPAVALAAADSGVWLADADGAVTAIGVPR